MDGIVFVATKELSTSCVEAVVATVVKFRMIHCNCCYDHTLTTFI
jgi:hypothetical protein